MTSASKPHHANVIRLKESKEHYTTAMDWTDFLFCSINLNLNYPAKNINLNMPKYTKSAPQVPAPKASFSLTLTSPEDPHPIWCTHSEGAHCYNGPTHPRAIKQVQVIVGTLLFYGRAVDSTLVAGLSSIITHHQMAQKPLPKFVTNFSTML